MKRITLSGFQEFTNAVVLLVNPCHNNEVATEQPASRSVPDLATHRHTSEDELREIATVRSGIGTQVTTTCGRGLISL